MFPYLKQSLDRYKISGHQNDVEVKVWLLEDCPGHLIHNELALDQVGVDEVHPVTIRELKIIIIK